MVSACLSLCRSTYVCLLAYNSGMGPGAIVSKISGCPRDGFTCQKFGERVMGRSQNTLAFFGSCRTGRPCATAGRFGTGQAIGAHTAVQADNEQTQQKQALVLTGRHAYYTRVRDAGALGGRKAERGCLRNAQLGGLVSYEKLHHKMSYF